MHLGELTLEELQKWLESLGEPSYRAKQIFLRIHKHLARSVDEFTELPRKLRDIIQKENLFPVLFLEKTKIVQEKQSDEGTEKFLFSHENNRPSLERRFESVWIVSPKRRTACVSSQSGCSLDCSFCATGKLPFRGNLKAWQILQQVYLMIRYRNPKFPVLKERLTNIVFMGMGEPFYNYEEVIRAAHFLHHPSGLNIGARHITISTAGVLPGLERFVKENQPFNLAISLNHPVSEKRSEIMPVNKKYPLEDIVKVAKEYVKKRKRAITFEYILIPGVNMSDADCRELIKLARDVKRCKINLIPLNTNFHGWRRPTEEEIEEFQRKLREAGILAFYRGSPGKTIEAACGMLAMKS